MSQPLTPQSASRPEAVLSLYQECLPVPILHGLFHRLGQRFYQRLLPPVLVVWGFIFQRLNPDHTCDAAWSYLSSAVVRAQFSLAPLIERDLSESNSAYCQARKRLPWAVVQGILATVARAIQARVGDRGLWQGLRVNLLDGSTLRLAASAELTDHYGVATNQYGPSHWPLLRLVVGFDLFSGVANGVTEGPYLTGEHTLAVQLIRRLGAGLLHVGDRNFGVYHVVQAMVTSHSDAVLRLKIRQAQKLAGGTPLRSGLDLDIVWSPSATDACEPDLPTPAVVGRLIYVRVVRTGFRPVELYLFTTLLERAIFSVQELLSLYGQRWNVELDLRHVKTPLQMEQLSGQSVDIVRKEVVLGLTAYSLLRGLMAVAAIQARRLPLDLSFAQCRRRILEVWRNLPPAPSAAEVAQAVARLMSRLGRCLLPKRTRERFEPRAVWGRPQVYPKIKGSRAQARAAWMEMLKNQKS